MYTLFRLLTVREFLTQQTPTIVISLAIAEMFYKFHSFLLESVAFLATWYAIDWVWQLVTGAFGKSLGRGPSNTA